MIGDVSSGVLLKLLAVFAVIGIGWAAGRTRILGPRAAATLGALAFSLLVPALLFRTAARVSLATLPWATVVGYYVPTVAMLLAVYLWYRLRRPAQPAVPAVRALSVSFSNSVQLGIPVATALFGAAGLAIHVTLASLQSLVLLTTSTVLAELDLARREGADPPTGDGPAPADGKAAVLATTVRRAVVHPVVLPVLLGLAYNATGWPIPGPVDDVLVMLGQAVVPVSLVTIGLTLAEHGLPGTVLPTLAQSLGKLVVQPAIVLFTAYVVLGLRGLPLTVAVMLAALPIGSNVLLFAQRYRVLTAEATAAIVVSTVGYLATATVWLLLLSHLPR
jgi:malonate transporter and related proteins